MSRRKRFVKELTKEQKEELEQGYLHGESSLYRKHCQAILLSNRGHSVPELMEIFGVRKHTIYDWLNKWESKGLEELKIAKGRGRKPLLDVQKIDEVEIVKSKIKENRKKLSLARKEIEKELGKTMCDETLRRFLKSLVIVGIDSKRV